MFSLSIPWGAEQRQRLQWLGLKHTILISLLNWKHLFRSWLLKLYWLPGPRALRSGPLKQAQAPLVTGYRVLYVQGEKADGRRRVFSGWKLVIVIWKIRGKFLKILVTVFKVILLRLISFRLTLFHLTTLPHPKIFYYTLPYSMHTGDS